MILNHFLLTSSLQKGREIRNSGAEVLFSINRCLTSDFSEKGSFNFPLWRGIDGEDAPGISLIKDQII
ncbi:hypothetical protein D3C87_18930 [compost metagenome]